MCHSPVIYVDMIFMDAHFALVESLFTQINVSALVRCLYVFYTSNQLLYVLGYSTRTAIVSLQIKFYIQTEQLAKYDMLLHIKLPEKFNLNSPAAAKLKCILTFISNENLVFLIPLFTQVRFCMQDFFFY